MPPYTPQEIIDQTNEYRHQLGLPSLIINKELMAAAQARADDMARTGNFSHKVATTSPLTSHVGFINQARYGGSPDGWNYAGENLARGFATAQDAMNSLKKSPTHNANLTGKNFRDTGVAIVKGTQDGQPSYYVVQLFGNQVQKAPTTKPLPKTVPQAKAKTIMKETIKKAKTPTIPSQKRPVSVQTDLKKAIPWNTLSVALAPQAINPLPTLPKPNYPVLQRALGENA